MSRKSSFANRQVHPQEQKMVKDIDAKELETVIINDLQYDSQFLHEQRITRLRTFAAFLLYVLRLPSWAALRNFNPLYRQAALLTLMYPPPHGALEYFEPRDEREASERAQKKASTSASENGSSMNTSGDTQGSASQAPSQKQSPAAAKPADGKAERTGPERPKRATAGKKAQSDGFVDTDSLAFGDDDLDPLSRVEAAAVQDAAGQTTSMDSVNDDAVAMATKSKQHKQTALTAQAQAQAEVAKKLREEEEQQANAFKMQTEMFSLVKQLAEREIASQSAAASAPESASVSASASASATVPDRFCSKCGKARNGRDPFCSGCGSKYAA